MSSSLVLLDDARIPGYDHSPLRLDNSPLCIVEDGCEAVDVDQITTAAGIATVLYRWCPEALYAFLDTDAWFSFTWLLTLRDGEKDGTKVEIGRVRSQITIGTLDSSGEKWTLMLTYNITETGPDRGSWRPNTKESMVDDKDVDNAAEIDTLGRNFARDLVINQRWLAAKGATHQLFVEYAPMDIFGDGIAMNPHWLYEALDLSQCTTCHAATHNLSKPLSRCGRCGTAAYCSSTCQRKDWPVHKVICIMNSEDRGQALHLSQHDGLVNWDRPTAEDMDIDQDGPGLSKNPHFAGPQPKRRPYRQTRAPPE